MGEVNEHDYRRNYEIKLAGPIPTVEEEREHRKAIYEALHLEFESDAKSPPSKRRQRDILRRVENFDHERKRERWTKMLEAESHWQRLLANQAVQYAARVIDEHGGRLDEFSMMNLMTNDLKHAQLRRQRGELNGEERD